MHLQLTRLLLAQMFNPIICFLFPVAGGCLAIALGFHIFTVQMYAGLAVAAVFPLVNAFLTCIFVGPYRKFTSAWLRFLFRLSTRQSENVVFSVPRSSRGSSVALEQDSRRRSTIVVSLQSRTRRLWSN
ncbi:hypothetical protein AAVH_24606 [Aphelenchoides avenae]|nr:hypothetical protein AAVH_24606 [Aphelenchus avenae]